MNLDIKKLDKEAIIPTYGTYNAAGADLYALTNENILINPNETKFIKTGVAMAIPKNYVGLIYARSGLSTKQGLAPANCVGVIDSDYRGEIIVALHNHSNEVRKVENKQRIAQIVIAPFVKVNFNEVDSLDDTTRGEGGFGSTGKN